MEDDLPRVRGDAASRLAGESLDSYSQAELLERIEVVRIKGLKCRSPVLIAHVSERDLADALFKPRNPG